MIPRAFAYEKPSNVDDVMASLARHGAKARILAGGQTLLVLLKTHAIAPEVVVDIGGIDQWRDLWERDDMLTIGSLATQSEFLESAPIGRRFPHFEEDAWLLGDPMIRNRGTLAGALAYADPTADWTALALVLEVRIHLRGATSERMVPVEQFLLDAFTTALGPTEVITHLTIAMPGFDSTLAYRKVHHPATGLAIAGAAVLVARDASGICRQCRVAVTGTGRTAVRASSIEAMLRGERLSSSTIARAAEGYRAGSDPRAATNHHARLARACIHRALLAALERAR